MRARDAARHISTPMGSIDCRAPSREQRALARSADGAAFHGPARGRAPGPRGVCARRLGPFRSRPERTRMTNRPRHVPVLLAEVLTALRPREGETHVDGTFGAGGYTRAILASGARVVAIDRDPSAIRAGGALVAEFPGRLTLVEGRFGGLDALVQSLGIENVDGVALDIGVSSMQFDEAERGFSLRFDGPARHADGRRGPERRRYPPRGG